MDRLTEDRQVNRFGLRCWDDRSSSGIGPSGVPWDKPRGGRAQACTVPLHAVESETTSTLCWTPFREDVRGNLVVASHVGEKRLSPSKEKKKKTVLSLGWSLHGFLAVYTEHRRYESHTPWIGRYRGYS